MPEVSIRLSDHGRLAVSGPSTDTTIHATNASRMAATNARAREISM